MAIWQGIHFRSLLKIDPYLKIFFPYLPWHSFPPLCALSRTFLLLDWTPPPQDVEQEVQDDHPDHTQSWEDEVTQSTTTPFSQGPCHGSAESKPLLCQWLPLVKYAFFPIHQNIWFFTFMTEGKFLGTVYLKQSVQWQFCCYYCGWSNNEQDTGSTSREWI